MDHSIRPNLQNRDNVRFPSRPFSLCGGRHHFNPQNPGFWARFAVPPCLLPIPTIPIRTTKPRGSMLNGSFYMPKPPESRHNVFVFRGPLCPSLSWRGGSDTTVNQQPTGFRARFADRPCLFPIPTIPVRTPKPGGSRLNGSFYYQTTKITTQHVHFPWVPYLHPYRGEGVPTPLLTSNLLVSGLLSLTNHASSRYPRFATEPRNQVVPG
jgi:hypothetical protein